MDSPASAKIDLSIPAEEDRSECNSLEPTSFEKEEKMSIRLELNCDRQTSHVCETMTGKGPGVEAYNPTAISVVLSAMLREAQKGSWKPIGNGLWACPACQESMSR